MTIITRIGKKLERIGDILAEYDHHISFVPTLIKLEGKTLEEANREQPLDQYKYYIYLVELRLLCKFLENKINTIRSKLFKQYTENLSIALSDRAINIYIDGDLEFVEMAVCLMEVKELCDKYSAVVDAYVTRGYTLNNITKSRVAGVEHSII